MTHFVNSFAMKEVTWNFSESGHGKSSADGIGGYVKRAADEGVARGADIADTESFLKTVRCASNNVNFFEVLPSDIEVVDAILPSKIKPVPNTMQIHQLTWSKEQSSVIGLRYLSCSSCSTCLCCHYALKPNMWKFSETACSSTAGILSFATLFIGCLIRIHHIACVEFSIKNNIFLHCTFIIDESLVDTTQPAVNMGPAEAERVDTVDSILFTMSYNVNLLGDKSAASENSITFCCFG